MSGERGDVIAAALALLMLEGERARFTIHEPDIFDTVYMLTDTGRLFRFMRNPVSTGYEFTRWYALTLDMARVFAQMGAFGELPPAPAGPVIAVANSQKDGFRELRWRDGA